MLGSFPSLTAPKLHQNLWGEPLGWHKFFGHSFRFHKGVLVSPSRRRGLGKGATSPPSPEMLSTFVVCSHPRSQKNTIVALRDSALLSACCSNSSGGR